MKNILTLFTALICAMQVISQNKFCGYVRDYNNNSPIAKATVFNPKNGNISLTNDLGFYEYIGNMNDTIIISCIGYNQRVKIIKIAACDSTQLTKKISEQPLVVVNSSIAQKISLGSSKKKTDGLLVMSPDRGILKYFNSSAAVSYTLSKLSIETKLAADTLESLIIKLVIYEATAKKEFGKMLLDSNALFVVNRVDFNPLTLDIKDYDIQMPINGLFVGIECVGIFNSTFKSLKNCSFGIKLLETTEPSYIKYAYKENYKNFTMPKKNKSQGFSPKFKLELIK